MLPVLVLLLASAPSFADLTVRSTIPRKFTVTCKAPDGAVKTANLSACSTALGKGTVDFSSAVKDCSFTLVDESGATAWEGRFVDDACVLVHEEGGKVQCVQAGWSNIANADPPKAFTFVNLTGQPLKLDLVRQDGGPGLMGVVVPAVPNYTLVTPAPGDERSFAVSIQGAGGEVLNPKAGSASRGTVRVFFKNTSGGVSQDEAGVLRPAARK